MATLDIVEVAAMVGRMNGGNQPRSTREAQLMAALAGTVTRRAARPPRWSKTELAFVRRQTGNLPDAEIGRRLGRTTTAVRIIRKRQGIPGPTQRNLTAREVGRIMGVDSKLVARWVDEGILAGRLAPVGKTWRAIDYNTLKRFVVNPHNWIYFDASRMTDPHLARLVALRRQRWGDEWWDTRQAGEYWGCNSHLVLKWIRLGRIPARQVFGFNNDYHILRSDVLAAGFLGVRGKGKSGLDWSEEGDAFMLLAVGVGVTHQAIAALQKMSVVRVYSRLSHLHKRGMVADIIGKFGLPALYYPPTRTVWADWRDCAGQFPAVTGAMTRLLAGAALRPAELTIVKGVVASWQRWECRQDAGAIEVTRHLAASKVGADYLRAEWGRLANSA